LFKSTFELAHNCYPQAEELEERPLIPPPHLLLEPWNNYSHHTY